MKLTQLLLLISLFTISTAGAEDLECLKKVSAFFKLEVNSSQNFEGKVETGDCNFHVDYRKSISGISNEEYRTLRMENTFDEPFEGEVYQGRTRAYLHFNDSLSKQSIRKCQVDGDKLVLDIKLKHKSGWKKKYRYRVTIEKNEQGLKSLQMEEKLYGSIWNTGGKDKGYCNFQ